MASEGSAKPTHRASLRTVANAAAFTMAVQPSLTRRWSRKVVQNTPPPLPLISLPPDDDWEEFDVPVKTGFGYTLPHLDLENEEVLDQSATTVVSDSSFSSTRSKAPLQHDRAAISRVLSEYMAQNEAFQVRRHGFGIDTTLVYKRTKSLSKKSVTSTNNGDAAGTDTVGVDDLVFDSFFESGNLDRAYRVLGRHYATTQEVLGGGSSTQSAGSSGAESSPWSSPFPFFVKADMEYDLYCDVDISTHGHIQWFFFRTTVPSICFTRPSTSQVLRVRFNIRNMLKKASLYNDGMLPAVYIDGVSGRGWHHAGANVCYFKNAETYRNRKSGKVANYYTLSFVYEFQRPAAANATVNGDPPPLRVYFAHCYPYTYSRMQRFLLNLQKDPERNRFFRRRVLCKTIAGNICDVLTITDFGQEDDSRSGVIITARVHPGESNASFIMHGLLDFLTGPSLEARYLRHRFVFKIVPMLNPDGVIHGNYRCSLAGTDLNRRYVDPSPELHPTVHATKNMILSMRKTRPVSLYCDIHGHSRKRNMFLYGCAPYEENSRTEAAKLRLFPHVLSKTCGAGSGGYFSFQDCTFSVSKSKKGTGRVVIWDEAHVLNSFTLEASFFGVGVNKKRHTIGGVMSSTAPPTNQQQQSRSDPQNALETSMVHFMPHDLRSAGTNLGLSLIPFSQLLDRDRPAAPPPFTTPVNGDEHTGDSGLRAFSSVQAIPQATATTSNPIFSSRPQTAITTPKTVDGLRASPRDPLDSKTMRLAPLLLPNSSLGSSISTPFLPSHTCKTSLLSPSLTESPSTSPRALTSPAPFRQLFNIGTMLTSLPSTEDLLREIEDTLPENYSHYGDSDDEGESAGSESDPSGDNMEAEELQRQGSWKDLIKDTTTVQDPPPVRLTKNRSQSLLKRFSDSMLRLTVDAADLQLDPPADLPPNPDPEPAKPTFILTSTEPAKVKPVMTLAPVKAPTPSTTYLVRRAPTMLPYQNNHPRDRNKDIAALHLRAVQRRSRSKRTSHRLVINEQELV